MTDHKLPSAGTKRRSAPLHPTVMMVTAASAETRNA
jgi:hypothetical protein